MIYWNCFQKSFRGRRKNFFSFLLWSPSLGKKRHLLHFIPHTTITAYNNSFRAIGSLAVVRRQTTVINVNLLICWQKKVLTTLQKIWRRRWKMNLWEWSPCPRLQKRGSGHANQRLSLLCQKLNSSSINTIKYSQLMSFLTDIFHAILYEALGARTTGKWASQCLCLWYIGAKSFSRDTACGRLEYPLLVQLRST